MMDKETTDFFVAGGTLPPHTASYVKRQADDKLLRHVLEGIFCYVLTPRQMGKSSLMSRTAHDLRTEGVYTAIIDLTQIGTVTVDQWYLGVLTQLERDLQLTTDCITWWQERISLGPIQRFTNFLREVVLKETKGKVVIFIDEIDTTLNLPFSDDFFAAIRATYNARANDPEFKRLTFVLLGVALPIDLMKDRTRTPFNIGQGIALPEFSLAEATVLQKGLEALYPNQAKAILARIFHWTSGHPYLTQKLCLTIAQSGQKVWDDQQIDTLVEQLFLTNAGVTESNLQFVQNKVLKHPQRDELLSLYQKVYQGQKISNNKQSLIHKRLKLSGLVKAENGYLQIRNRIYARVFDLSWVKENRNSWASILSWFVRLFSSN